MTAYEEEVVVRQAHQVTEVSLDTIISGLKKINDMIRRQSEFWSSLSEDEVREWGMIPEDAAIF